MNNPQLTIITINLNNATGLRKTIESVVSQTFSDFEYIVIDGGSTDGSIDVLNEYSDKINFWVSELDKGIYNAMNKGIVEAKGEYCLFLNSGDWLVDENVIADFIKLGFMEDIISGNTCIGEDRKISLESPKLKKFNYGFFYNNSLPHCASFIKRNLFTVYGLYDENYKIVSDWKFFMTCLLLHNCTYSHFERIITHFDLTGFSNKPEMRSLQYKEKAIILRTIMPSFYYKAYKDIWDKNVILESYVEEYREYMNLKHGKLSFLIRFLLFLKNKRKQYF